MSKKLIVLGLSVLTATAMAGCDQQTLANVAPVAAKMFLTTPGSHSGALLMAQAQTQDRRRNGTGSNCPNPGDPGAYDGAGSFGVGGSNNNGGGQGAGSNGGDRLPDGSCGG